MARLAATDRASIEAVQPIKIPYVRLSNRDNNVYQYGDVLYSRKSANTKILQKSVDYGSSWTDVYTFTYDVGIVIVAANGNILVSQKSSSDLYVDPPGYLELSTDNGQTFAPVHTVDNGGFGVWSFSVHEDTILLAGYGKYASGTGNHVYKSDDGGATWSIIFTHPLDGSTTQHIHKVYIDPFTPTTYFISSGDSAPAKGVWYSEDSGETWNVLTRDHQPTQIVANSGAIFLGEDLEGKIHRINKGDFSTALIETVYDATADTRGNFGKLSFYSASVDMTNDAVYFGGVAYGAASTQNNNKDAAFIVSPDEGSTWVVLSQFPSQSGTTSTGVNFLSDPDSRGRMYVRTNNTSAVYILNTSDISNRLASLMLPRTAVARKALSHVHVPNLNMSVIPVGSTATNTALRWLDGTAGGSQAQVGYGWAIPSGGISGSANAKFDNSVVRNGIASLKIDLTTTTAGLSISTYRNVALRDMFPLLPNTTYTLTGYVRTLNTVANGAYIDLRQFNSSAGTVTTTSTNKVSGTDSSWRELTLTVTTGATTVAGGLLLRHSVIGNVSTAWFADVSLMTARTRTAV